MQQPSNLNLARKWRSKSFEEIVGQDLVVRMLKNSLYIDQFFPVYLFSGQRGCGKTSTARIFAAALNCSKLRDFQKNPKVKLPCDTCDSCVAMQRGRHPDFIEMDAASHTGVDNVRNIIDASTFMPVLGQKKVYLIDEAHMLSKAAFNAFLKILEEPPLSVVFILATTDPEKIIDTVKSRCFQLIFSSIDKKALVDRLEKICKQEKIDFDIEGLELIVNESEGSARDAINLMEQVRFSAETNLGGVSKLAVQKVLGHPDDSKILKLFELIFDEESESGHMLRYLSEIEFLDLSAQFVWYQIFKLLRVSLYLKHGVKIETNYEVEKLRSILSNVSIDKFITISELFYKNEPIFLKTSNKNLFLEVLLLKSLEINKSDGFSRKSPLIEVDTKKKTSLNEIKSDAHPWDIFLAEVEKIDDPMAVSIFKQAKFVEADLSNNKIIISFYKNYSFLISLLDDNRELWQPILKKIFKVENIESKVLEFSSNAASNISTQKKDYDVKNRSYSDGLDLKKNTSSKVDIKDKDKWKLANMLLEAFPGEIIEVKENE